MLQSAVAVAVAAVFILSCLHGADGGNLTMTLATESDDEASQNLTRLIGVKVKVIEQDEPFSGKNAPPPPPKATEKTAKVSEGHANVRGKWESGNFTVISFLQR